MSTAKQCDSAKIELIAGRRASRIGVTSGEEWLTLRGFALLDGHELPVC